jgi:hypothetical protein
MTGARELREELLEPVDALGVEVVGRLVEQQHVGLRQQEPAQRDAALLAAREIGDLRVPRRQAQRVRRDLHLHVGSGARRRDDRFQASLLRRQLVEVGVGLGVGCVDFLELGLGAEDLAHPLLDGLAHRLLRVELGLLRQEADAQARHRRCFAFVFLVLAGHDAQQARLAGAVQAQHADLGAGEERKGDVLQDDALGGNHLPHAVHRVHVLRHSPFPRAQRSQRKIAIIADRYFWAVLGLGGGSLACLRKPP